MKKVYRAKITTIRDTTGLATSPMTFEEFTEWKDSEVMAHMDARDLLNKKKRDECEPRKIDGTKISMGDVWHNDMLAITKIEHLYQIEDAILYTEFTGELHGAPIEQLKTMGYFQ